MTTCFKEGRNKRRVDNLFIFLLPTYQSAASPEEVLWGHCQAGVHRRAGHHTHEEQWRGGGSAAWCHLHLQGPWAGGEVAAGTGEWHDQLTPQGKWSSGKFSLLCMKTASFSKLRLCCCTLKGVQQVDWTVRWWFCCSLKGVQQVSWTVGCWVCCSLKGVQQVSWTIGCWVCCSLKGVQQAGWTVGCWACCSMKGVHQVGWIIGCWVCCSLKARLSDAGEKTRKW